MAEKVAEVIESKSHLVVEAGTGTGKSLAYLVPAAYAAEELGKKAIISTYTIHLQEQLFGKDVPIVQSLCHLSLRPHYSRAGRTISVRTA